MELTSWLVALVVVIATLYWLLKKPKHLPPSPGLALPIVGHLYLLERDPRQQFKKWSQKLGDVFSLKLGQETIVVLNSFEVIKEAFVKHGDSISDRPTTSFLARNVQHMTKGVVRSSGAYWKEQRSVSLSILRGFGMGKNILAEKITEEVAAFVKELAKGDGRAFKAMQFRSLINVSISNVICSIIFGKRFEFDDPKIQHLTSMLNDIAHLTSGVSKLNFLPCFKYLPKYKLNADKLISETIELREFATKMVNEIRKNYDPNNLDNYILAYVNEMEKKQNSEEPTNLSDISLIRNIENLFLAGTETTSTTILWSLYFVLKNPEIQTKLYQEIKEKIGTDRQPNISDKARLKYLNAFIMETQRVGSLVPFALNHVCSQDTVLNGFTIPKGAQVIPNVEAVLKDEKIWGDPENFRPERFIDEQGSLLTREELIPFSIGRRICLGESLAKMELFLFLSSMFQKFEFLPADPNFKPSEKDVFGGVVSPVPFAVKCVERSH
ncbi:cytochrome P450 2J4-like [Physella acuta]|uniref:cytochrome P450 2J4-like n=1 Tax=Physella acuta TaxID=109671 RepID=UPI0027DBB593|nr:cytochrome P450 2J4-like [Physella acuta]